MLAFTTLDTPVPRASAPQRRPSARLAWTLAGALALGVAAWGALQMPTTMPLAAHATPRASIQPAMASDVLASLRQAAALGNVDASIALVGALLDRYDAGGGADALFEALQWMERDLDTAPMLNSRQVQRVVLGACASDPLLDWHWLCHQGE